MVRDVAPPRDPESEGEGDMISAGWNVAGEPGTMESEAKKLADKFVLARRVYLSLGRSARHGSRRRFHEVSLVARVTLGPLREVDD